MRVSDEEVAELLSGNAGGGELVYTESHNRDEDIALDALLDLRDARAALRLAVEAMERMLAYPEVDKFVGTLTHRPMSAALAACRKAVGDA